MKFPARMKPERLLRIISSTEEDIAREDMILIFGRFYGIEPKEASDLVTETFDKIMEEQSE